MDLNNSVKFVVSIKTKTIFGLTLLLLSIASISMYGQNGSIIGKVVEISTGEPMQFANIALHQASDTLSIFKGTSTNEVGVFLFENISSDKYFIRVSFIGFESNQTSIFTHGASTNVGEISIRATDILLEDVTITGEKSLYVQEIDKRVYNVGKDILSKSGSVSEILQNIPSITVDVNGEVTLRGTSNITFLVNGRPSALLRRSSATTLQQMPANTIERIEVITNPSAKYKPDGTGGIINIVLKEETGKGFNGQITANIGNEERYNASITANYGTNGLNIFANYGIRHSARTVIYSDERTYRDSLGKEVLNYYDEEGNGTNDAFSHIANLGLNYEINNFNSFEISGTYYHSNTLHNSISNISLLSPEYQPETVFTSNETNDEYESEGEASASWEHVFKSNEDHSLVFEATFAAYDEQEDLSYIQDYSLPAEEQTVETNLIQKSGNQTEVKAEYVLPVGEDIEIEAGYVGEFIEDDIKYTYKDNGNHFLFNQNVNAMYAIYGQNIESFSFKAGLRLEQANIKSHLVTPIDSLISKAYFKPYPTLHLGYELSDDLQLGLSYSKRVNRPDPDELNPFPEFSDPRNAEAGNPNLKPEQIHSLELGLHWQGEKLSLTPALYYRYKYDAFTVIKTPLPDSVLLTTIENLNDQQSAGLELILSGQILEHWNINLSGDVYYNQINASNLGYSENKSVISGTVKLYSFCEITASTLFQLNAFYYSPRITPQGQRDQFFYMNVGLKQLLFKNRLALTLTVTDVLHTYKRISTIDTPEFSQRTEMYRKQPVVYFGFTWYFNQQNNHKKELEFDGEGM